MNKEKMLNLIHERTAQEAKEIREEYLKKTSWEVLKDIYYLYWVNTIKEMFETDFIDVYLHDNTIKWISEFDHPISALYEEFMDSDAMDHYDWDTLAAIFNDWADEMEWEG